MSTEIDQLRQEKEKTNGILPIGGTVPESFLRLLVAVEECHLFGNYPNPPPLWRLRIIARLTENCRAELAKSKGF